MEAHEREVQHALCVLGIHTFSNRYRIKNSNLIQVVFRLIEFLKSRYISFEIQIEIVNTK
jgi:hypothetical protein